MDQPRDHLDEAAITELNIRKLLEKAQKYYTVVSEQMIDSSVLDAL